MEKFQNSFQTDVIFFTSRSLNQPTFEGEGASGSQLGGGVLGVWIIVFFNKITNVPFCSFLIISKRAFSLDWKGLLLKIFWALRTLYSFFLYYRAKRLHWGSLDFRTNHTSNLPALFSPCMNLQKQCWKAVSSLESFSVFFLCIACLKKFLVACMDLAGTHCESTKTATMSIHNFLIEAPDLLLNRNIPKFFWFLE